MKKILLILALCSTYLVFTSCSSDSLGVEENVLVTPDQANALKMELGQEFHYLKFYVYDSYNNGIFFPGDTVIVKVVKKEQGLYYIKEGFFSTNFFQSNNEMETLDGYDKNSNFVFDYFMTNKDDSLIIYSKDGNRIQSHLFDSSFVRLALPLKQIDSNPVTALDWNVSWGISAVDKQGYIENHVQLDNFYSGRLNVVSFDAAMAVDSPGRAFIFSKEYGIVRVITYGGDRSVGSLKGFGWYLM